MKNHLPNRLIFLHNSISSVTKWTLNVLEDIPLYSTLNFFFLQPFLLNLHTSAAQLTFSSELHIHKISNMLLRPVKNFSEFKEITPVVFLIPDKLLQLNWLQLNLLILLLIRVALLKNCLLYTSPSPRDRG